MTSSKMDKIGNFMKRWINSVVYAGYNPVGVLCFYVVKGIKAKEIPFTWELIQDDGLERAWSMVKAYLGRNYSFAYDYKSDCLIAKGILE